MNVSWQSIVSFTVDFLWGFLTARKGCSWRFYIWNSEFDEFKLFMNQVHFAVEKVTKTHTQRFRIRDDVYLNSKLNNWFGVKLFTKSVAIVSIVSVELHLLYFQLCNLCNFSIDDSLCADRYIEQMIKIVFHSIDLWSQQINFLLNFPRWILSPQKFAIRIDETFVTFMHLTYLTFWTAADEIEKKTW